MSDINKIQIIHDLKNKFDTSDDMINILTEQIEESKYKENIDRFFRGYKVEDSFGEIFSEIPWVKLIHGLSQLQLPIESKNMYQVPDYNLIYETSNLSEKSILIEIKSVKGDKSTLALMEKQVNALKKYADIQNTTIVIAIFWNKVNSWTINSLESFEPKAKKLKITLIEAIKNDLSIIAGDLTFIIPKLYRKSIFDSSIDDDSKIGHENYGVQISDSISIDNNKYISIETLESAILDSSINFKEINKKIDGTKTSIIEESDNIYSYKLSSLMLRFLSMMPSELQNAETRGLSKIAVIEFMKKANIKYSYMIPHSKNHTIDRLFKDAFENTIVWDNYKQS